MKSLGHVRPAFPALASSRPRPATSMLLVNRAASSRAGLVKGRTPSFHLTHIIELGPPYKQPPPIHSPYERHILAFEPADAANVTSVASEADPFCRFAHLMRVYKAGKLDRYFAGAEALDSIHPSALEPEAPLWPERHLRDILKLKHTPESLSALFNPVAAAIAYTENLRDAITAFSRYIGAVNVTENLAAVPPLVDIVIGRLEEHFARESELSGAGVAVERTIGAHVRFLTAFARTGSSANARDYPRTIQAEMARLVFHLLDTLEKQPSSSEQKAPSLALKVKAVDALFGPRLLTPFYAERLIVHCLAAEVPLTEVQWRQVATAGYSGGKGRAAPYVARAAMLNAAKSDDQIDPSYRVMLAAEGKSFKDAIAVLEPLLKQPLQIAGDKEYEQNKETLSRAWSTFATACAREPSIQAHDLVELANRLPEDYSHGYTMTPLVVGLVKRRAFHPAAAIWGDLVKRHRLAPKEDKSSFLDAAALSVGAQLMYARLVDEGEPNPVRAPVSLVDYYGARAFSQAKLRFSVPMDVQVLNTLLYMCRLSGKPGIALRLWEAAWPRWRIRHDDISLSLVLDCAKHCTANGFDSGQDSVRGRLRELADAMMTDSTKNNLIPLDTGPLVAVPEKGWTNCPTTALLDPKSAANTWRKEHGSSQPWDKAEQLFRRIVLTNWPKLLSIKNPIDHDTGTFIGLFELLAPPPAFKTTTLNPWQRPPVGQHAPYSYLIPSAKTWLSYIQLLVRYFPERATTEVPRALAWMRTLHVRPQSKALVIALAHVSENEGPRRRVRFANGDTKLVRDEEVLRAWLAEWLDKVPSEDIVAEYQRTKQHVVSSNEA